MNPDEILRQWSSDLSVIKQDVYDLFRLRRTLRDVGKVFRENVRLQQTGAHVWDWMVVNHVAATAMALRRLIDSQFNTISLKRLMHAIAKQPHVITRARRNALYPVSPGLLSDMLDGEFTNLWVREQHENPDDDHVDAGVVDADRIALEKALEKVEAFANQVIGHRQRVPPPNDLTFGDVDVAFDAVEATLIKYHALLAGASIAQAEPTPQFNTHEVFTFPWIEQS